MTAWWCVYCELSWPHEPRYRSCPMCHESCRYNAGGDRGQPMHPSEAQTKANHGDFGWWLWETGRL